MLVGGAVAHDGSPDEVIDHYNALIAKRTSQYHINIQKGSDGRAMTRSGSKEAIILSADIVVNGASSRGVTSANPVLIVVSVKIQQPVSNLCAGILIRDRWGNDVWGTNSFHHGAEISSNMSGEIINFNFYLPNLYLSPGSYSISAALHPGDSHLVTNFDWFDRLLTFDVIQGKDAPCAGVCNLPVEITVARNC